MVAAWEATLEVVGGADSINKILPRSSAGRTPVWSGDMGAHGNNESEDRGSACELLRQVTRTQVTEGRDGSWRQVPTEEVLKGAGTQTIDKDIFGKATGNSGVVGDHPDYFRGVCAKYGVRRRGETLGAVVEAECSKGAAEGHVRSNFDSGKVRRQQESGRRERSEEGSEGGSTESGE